MKIIRTFTAPDLGKTMPKGVLRMVTAEEHNRRFYAFDTTDVWTSDGWVITAVQNDGVTHHMRKGCDAMVAELAPETMLHYKPTPKTLYMLGETDPSKMTDSQLIEQAHKQVQALNTALDSI